MASRPQFRISHWFWVTLVVAAFFLGRSWDSLTAPPPPKPTAPAATYFGVGVNSNAGVTGQIVLESDSP